MTKNAKDRDRALALGQQPDMAGYGAEADDEENLEDGNESEAPGSKTVVIHLGSQNLRIGLASDAIPKSVPMVIARRAKANESENVEPNPKRQKMNGERKLPPEDWFGSEVSEWTCRIVGTDSDVNSLLLLTTPCVMSSRNL